MRNGPIRLAIDARPFAGPACGYTIYLGSILQCLRDADIEVVLLGNAPLLPRYEETAHLETRIFGKQGHLGWEQRDLPRYLATAGHDLYFTGANRGIPLRKTPTTRYLLGLLDVIPYLFFRNYFLARWRVLLRNPRMNAETLAQLIAVARADAILTISQQSARDIRRLFRHRDVTARLIRLKAVDVPSPAPPKPQFVYVGGVDARKKVDVLLRGFAAFARDRPDHRLVLIGPDYSSVAPLITQLGLERRVVMTGYVDHDAKFRNMGDSLAMVYPSLYEGYGLAIAEGFQAGIPVIAGQGGSQGEVGGAGIRPIDPSSADEITAAMSEMLDPAVRAAWIARGQAQLAHLTDPRIETDTLAWFSQQGRLARA